MFLIFLGLMLGLSTMAHAGLFCSEFPVDPSDASGNTHLIDGTGSTAGSTLPNAGLYANWADYFAGENITQITVDTSCTFRNWNPLDVTINYQTPTSGAKPIYLITFDNVNFTGNLGCGNVPHLFYVVNSTGFSSTCQSLFVPVEAINKNNPAGKTTVGLGETYTYTLKIPVLQAPDGSLVDSSGTNVDISDMVIKDDLNATGASLTYVSSAVSVGGTTLTAGTNYNFSNNGGVLTFDLRPTYSQTLGTVLPAGSQVQIDITVNVDNSNTIGTQIVNTATWTFSRVFTVDLNGDGIPETYTYDPITGENGISAPLTIGAPALKMDKTSLDTTLSPGGTGNFTLDVQNIGSTDAWQTTVVDKLPQSLTATMCSFDPTTGPITANIYQADGTTLVRNLSVGTVPGSDVTVSFDNSPTAPSPCLLTFNLANSSNTVIQPGQRLILTYQAQLGVGATVNGEVLTNYAGATKWYSADNAYPRTTYTGTLTDGTPGNANDEQDFFNVTVGLAGYYFQKTVSNLTSGASPATTAQPGDTLRYRLRVFNVNQNVNGVVITDDLDALNPPPPVALDLSSFQMSAQSASDIAALGGKWNYDSSTGQLVIDSNSPSSLDIPQGSELVVEFDINTTTAVSNGDVISNQALLSSTSGNNVKSDDPFINGVNDPQDPLTTADPTNVTIVQPGPLSKSNGPASAVIGDTFTYTITVPATPSATPLYDVRVLDTLGVDSSGTNKVADVSYVGATVSGGSWILTNTGTANAPVLEDTGAGIDIPAGGQAVITVTARLDDTATNQAGVQFYNTATYTYDRTNDVPSSQVTGGGVTTTTPTTVFEPGIVTFNKTASNTSPTVGQTVHYTITMTAQSGANVSDVYDVTLLDNLDLGLAYVPNSAKLCIGPSPGTACTPVSSTDVTGDGITTSETLSWGTANVNIDIPAGNTVYFEYDVQVTTAALANQTLNNRVSAQWTSINGTNTFERNGNDGPGGAVDDYATPVVSAPVTTPNVTATITKARTSDTYGPGDNEVRIGDIVQYTLTIPVPEGTLGNVNIVDTLPKGLNFLGVVSINGDTTAPYSAVAPFVYNDFDPTTGITQSGDPTTGLHTVTWSLGNVSNPYNDGAADNFVIVYQAQVMNNSVLAQQNSTTLNNSVVLSYDTATVTSQATANTDVVVDQPALTVSKTATTATGDSIVDPGEVVTYTVDITNTGSAPAYDTVLQDIIPVGLRGSGVITVTSMGLYDTAGNTLVTPLTAFGPTSFNTSTGLAIWNFDNSVNNGYTIPVGQTLRIVYNITADASLGQGLVLTNAATATQYWSFDNQGIPTGAAVTDRQQYGPSNTANSTLYTGAPPTKTLISPSQATIGDEVVYQIKVPGTVSAAPLYDVHITDALDPSLVYTSAIITGATGTVTNNSTVGGSALDLNISLIPAGEQVTVELHTRVADIGTAQEGVVINNTASYTYGFTPGGTRPPALVSNNAATVTVTEPQLTITSKTATLITAAPITGGDIIEYAITVHNANTATTSTAYDVNLADTLPAGMTRISPASATINGTAVTGFNGTPSGSATTGIMIWGHGNSDDTLDIPPNGTLVLTYQAQIDQVVQPSTSLVNSVMADWTSLNGSSTGERNGAGCPAITAPDDYCTGPVTSTVTTADTTSFSKSVTSDSYPPTNDAILRVGDTVTYALSLTLQKGTTNNVIVSDTLDPGLEFVGVVSINGDNTADYTPPASGAGSNFSYAAVTAAALPSAGATGTLNFNLGNIVNNPAGDPTTNTLVIVYQARVATGVITQQPSTTLNNNAVLNYVDGSSNPKSLPASSSIDVHQPVMSPVTKLGNGAANTNATPLSVNVVSDTIQFTLESCNTSGLAPAYNVRLSDTLATQLDETSISGVSVTVGGAPATYTDNLPVARGGTMQFDVSTPVNPGQCVTVLYTVGFHNDFGPNQLWSNNATVNEYWSLNGQTGQRYTPTTTAQFWMTNTVMPSPLTKSSVPASGDVTIGDSVVYTITVPGTPVGAALFDVGVTDTINSNLVVDNVSVSGGGTGLVNSSSGNNLNLSFSQIPAGQQAVITVTTHVANTTSVNAKNIFNNTAGYTYADNPGGPSKIGGGQTTGNLLITEPALSMLKSVTNVTNTGQPPKAGDTLRYTLQITASGGAVGDNFSDAFDVAITDDLSLGLTYQSGSFTVNGAGNTLTNPVITGDGINTPERLVWSPANSATNKVDVPEGTTVTITYDVLVDNSVLAGQTLTNSAVAEWTSIDGTNANERNGAGCPTITAPNDYCTGPATTSLTTLDPTALSKTRLTDTYGASDANVRIGDIVEFELRAKLPEGTTRGVVFTDTLPQGMQFEEAIINGVAGPAPYAAVAPFSYAPITPTVTGNPLTGPTTLTFNVGDIVNAGNNNPADDDFVIVYRVRLLNNVFAQVNSTALNNSAQMNYTNAVGPQTLNASSGVTLQQPVLSVTKTEGDADNLVSAGDSVTYTIDVTNNGLAPAYNVVVQDILPVGMRQTTPVTTAILLPAPTSAALFQPNYNSSTGTITWNFNTTGSANDYTILPGQTLRIVYNAKADATLGAGVTLTNQAVASTYYSYDTDAAPNLNNIPTAPQIYGPTTPPATTTLTSPVPGALLKQTPFELSGVAADQYVSIGDTVTYRITVPAAPVSVALHDVRILDNLTASAAALSLVNFSASGTYTGTVQNTGSTTNLVFQDPVNGIDIPANGQIILNVTVRVDNTNPPNVGGLVFNNTASYVYKQYADGSGPDVVGGSDTSGDMIIVEPTNLTLVKTGPAQMRIGVPGAFRLNVHNDNTSGSAGTAWDITVVDKLPNLSPGGMCDTPPDNIVAGIYLADGTTLVRSLTQNVDYVVNFDTPSCTLTVTMQSANAALPADNRLIIDYQGHLDTDTPPNSTMTNIAGVTQWFSNDTAGAGATGGTRTFTRVITDGTPSTLDFQDAHSLVTEQPVIQVLKSVVNQTNPSMGANAKPGDTLRYTIMIKNVSPVDLPNFSFIDDLGALNTSAVFSSGSLSVPAALLPPGATNSSNVTGGTNGTGLVQINNLSLGGQGTATDTVQLVFDVTLLPVLPSGTAVLNQGRVTAPGVSLPTDDPNDTNGPEDPAITGDEDPTKTVITSAPLYQVKKTSQDLTGDPNVLVSGDTLRYTITVKNVGDENAVNATLTDALPANTTYVVGSTKLNGAVINGASTTLPLINGIPINAPAPENTTAGFLRADSNPTAGNVATITFDVTINSNVVTGTVISNQAFLNANGEGNSGSVQQPSDDPGTTAVDDPTQNVVGNVPLIDSQKTVSISNDLGSPGVADIGDTLTYTITITNKGPSLATGVTLTDAVPANTTYVPGSVKLNGLAVPDVAGTSPLVAGIDISSDDRTPPLPVAGGGIISSGGKATVTFDVVVAGTAIPGVTVISNQGSVDNDQTPAELTDADGIDSNGDQPTLIPVGNSQTLSINKQVSVVGGGPALAGSTLEYRILVSNIGTLPATNVTITDNLDLPVANQLSYVAGSESTTAPASVNFAAPILTAAFSNPLAAGASVELRFRAVINSSLAIGTTITNTGVVSWNSGSQTASDSVSIDVGGVPGVASIGGTLWHDSNYNNVFDTGELPLAGWTVELYLSGVQQGSAVTDASGVYSFSGLAPNDVGTDKYEVRFIAPGATTGTALLGVADSPFTNTLQNIANIIVSSGNNLQTLNLPIDPNGVVYNAVLRTPVAGATLTMLNASNGNLPVPASCFDDVNQQNQVTRADGYYKFDLNFSSPGNCSPGQTYVIQITPPPSGYVGTTSSIIPPALALTDPPFSVPGCPGSVDDQLSTTPDRCEIQSSEFAPPTSVPPRTTGTKYYLQFTLGNNTDPFTSQIFNNHIPLDPDLGGALAISKTSALLNVTRSQLVPYTITLKNSIGAPLQDINVVDSFPAGFKYVAGSSRVDGIPTEPQINGLQLTWPNLSVNTQDARTIKLLLVVGSGVSEGEYINRAQAINNRNGQPASGQANATVRVVPDPTFDCSDVIGKVFDDKNLNGYQDQGETGIPSARVYTARGIEAKTDQYGRFHITCAVVPNEDRGSNFIMKLDEHSLPSGYRVTTENPRVERATRGKMLKFNFGAAIHHVVRLDMADAVFTPGSTKMRPQWKSRLNILMEKLVEAPSILRLSYMGDIEPAALVDKRVRAVKKEIARRWADLKCCYRLEIETEVFWRRGKPVSKDDFK